MNSRSTPISIVNTLLCVFAAMRWLACQARRSTFIGSLAALAALALAPPTQAATNTWNGSTGNWSTAGSWATGSVPTSADDVVVNAGTLTLTTGALAASLSCSGGTIATNGFTLSVSGSTSASCAAVLNGAGALSKSGVGTQTLTGANTYTGATTVTAGTLLVNGNQLSATGAVTVQTGGTLGGSGTLGNVTINSGGRLSPGNSPGTITVTGLSLPSGSNLDIELGQANTIGGTFNDRVQDNGDLSLGGGTLNISQSAGGNFTVGTYRLIDYTGTLTNSGGLVLGTIPAGFAASQLVIDTSTAGQVNLIVLATGATYWDVSPKNDSVVNGGTGGWSPTGSGGPLNWTDSGGVSNTQWFAGGTAIFQATAGTVTVTGAPDIGGLTFNVDGYTLTGGTLNGTAASNVITVAAGMNTNIDSALSGTAFNKKGTGTLILRAAGSGTYTGTTTVSAGSLVVQNNTGLGTSAAGTTVVSGATLELNSGVTITGESLTLSGTGDSGRGAFRPSTAAAGGNNWTGPITLAADALITNALGIFNLSGTVNNAGFALSVNASTGAVPTFSGIVSGSGSLEKSGVGTLALTAANTYGGITTVSGGTLQLGINSALPSASAATVATGATLDVNGNTQSLVSLSSSGTLALGTTGNLTLTTGASSIGAITGTGTITLNPGATLTLAAALSNTGVNIVLAGGTLNLGVFTHSIGTLSLTAASTLDFASAGTAQLTVDTLTPAFALNVTNWTQGTDRFYATAVSPVPSARNTVNLSPLNNITMTGRTAPQTVWLSTNDEISVLLAPGMSKVFSPTTVGTGVSSTLTITLSNSSTSAVGAAAFTDTYPANLINATTPSGATTCTGGTVTAAAGGSSVALSGGSIPAGSTCTVTVNVTSNVPGNYTNTIAIGALTSNGGSNAVAATATLTVTINGTYWDGPATNTTSVEGGSGTWDATTNNWTLIGGTPNGPWAAGTSVATFSGTPGTVTVSGAPDMGGLTFNTGTAATSYTLSGGTLNGTATETVLNAAAGTENFVNVVLSGGAYAKTGTGIIHLHNNTSNTFTGVMDIRAGTLFVDQANALGAAGGTSTSVQSGASLSAAWGVNIAELITLNGGSMGCQSNFTTTGFSRAITLTAPSTIYNLLGGPCGLTTGATVNLGANALTLFVPNASSGTLTAQDVISGTGTITKTGAGTASLNAANTYGGTTTVSAGTLQLGIDSALPSVSVTTVALGATLNVNGRAQSLASLSSSGTVALGSNGSLTLTTGASSIGAITGSGTLTLNAGATLTLTSALSNTGVNIVLAGGTLNLGALTHSMGTLSLTAASTLDFASAGTAQLTVATLTPAFALSVTNWTQGTDRFYAAAVSPVPSARNTINLSPLNNITLSGSSAPKTAWLSTSNEIYPLSAPGILKVFSPATIGTGVSSLLTITLSNPNAAALTAAAFTDTYPVNPNNLINATTPSGTTTCGSGSVTADAGSNSVALSGGTIAANGSCTVTVNVTSNVPGTYTNTLAVGALTSSGGSSAVAATASLTVTGGTISGHIFFDNGADSGTANDGIPNGAELPQAGITVSLSNCSGTVYSKTMTDSTGNYYLRVPSSVTTGALLCVEQTNQTGRLSTGASIGGTALSSPPAALPNYNRTTDSIAFTFSGTSHNNLNFADVNSSTFGAASTKTGPPGNSVSYPHTFVAQTAGSVTFSVATSVSTPTLAGWSEKIVLDTGCTGTLQAGATVLYPPAVAIFVTAGQQVCIIMQGFIPGTAQSGYRNDAKVQVSLSLSGASPALTAVYALDDVTWVSSSALELKKEVRNVTQNVTVFGVNNQAKSGEILEYRITYTNNGASLITALSVSDATPNHTTFVSAAVGTTPAGLTACQKNTPANPAPANAAVACPDAQAVGGSGTLLYKFTGALNPSATGTVTFQVKVD